MSGIAQLADLFVVLVVRCRAPCDGMALCAIAVLVFGTFCAHECGVDKEAGIALGTDALGYVVPCFSTIQDLDALRTVAVRSGRALDTRLVLRVVFVSCGASRARSVGVQAGIATVFVWAVCACYAVSAV